MHKSKVIVSGIAWTIILNVVSVLYGIISVPFLINYFGKDEYGLIGLALSVNIYINLLDMGMTNSNVRFFSEYITKSEKENVQKLFSLTNLFYLLVGILNSFVLFGVSLFVSDIFKVTTEQAIVLRNLLWILGLNATFSWLSICFDQLLRANELIDWIKKRATILKLMQFVILGLTIWMKLSIEIYFFGYIFIVTTILPLTIVKTKRIVPELRLKPRFDREMFNTVFPYAISLFSFSIFQFLAFNFRPLILGNMSGPGAVAEFNVMNTIAMVVTIISGSFTQVLLPVVTKMSVNNDQKSIEKTMYLGTKYVTILLSGIIFTIIASMEEIFTLYVGSEYVSLAKWMVLWLITLLLAHRNVMTSLVFTEQKIKSVAYMGAVAMSIALICYYFFIPIYGVGGVVIGFAAHEIIHTLFYYVFFLPKKFGLNTARFFFSVVMPVWLTFGVVCIFSRFLEMCEIYSIIETICLKTAICCIIFSSIIWLCFFNKEDKSFIISFFKRRLNS